MKILIANNVVVLSCLNSIFQAYHKVVRLFLYAAGKKIHVFTGNLM